jgi:hypothetical protein
LEPVSQRGEPSAVRHRRANGVPRPARAAPPERRQLIGGQSHPQRPPCHRHEIDGEPGIVVIIVGRHQDMHADDLVLVAGLRIIGPPPQADLQHRRRP